VNHGEKVYTFEPGERIAQLLVTPVPNVEVVEVEELSDSAERGAGGFGSTGRLHNEQEHQNGARQAKEALV
jgi:dUTP pyrophosphatase